MLADGLRRGGRAAWTRSIGSPRRSSRPCRSASWPACCAAGSRTRRRCRASSPARRGARAGSAARGARGGARRPLARARLLAPGFRAVRRRRGPHDDASASGRGPRSSSTAAGSQRSSHDPSLADEPQLVRAAGAAAALALENQRLSAELRARIEELRATSRARLVEAGDAERRRLERDLHDGAQSRLVALAMKLRLRAAGGRGLPELAALLDESSAELQASLDELRELARGIHPAVLTDRGLGPALETLAGRAPVPVEITGERARRPPRRRSRPRSTSSSRRRSRTSPSTRSAAHVR